ncbi:hypothetical protein CROQUDRAFT_40970, partial [Cronartium quercuum f. sp. fusiforme G11]
ELKVVLNVQHNCHDGKCKGGKDHFKKVEHQETSMVFPHVVHEDTLSFILNSSPPRKLHHIEACYVT